MNISLKNNGTISGIVKLEIVKADYATQVEKGLRTFRQKANVPGFRKGMVPMSLVKKMYGSMYWLKRWTSWSLKTCSNTSARII